VLADERGRQAIVVDPGDEVERILAVLKKHGLTVGAIVATHAHIDHVGALASLKQLTGAPAMIHEGDVPLYEHLAEQAAWLGVAVPRSTTLDRYLKESQPLEFGACKLEVVHTPGHSPGSVSFIAEDVAPVVLSGDTLFAGSIGRTDLWGGSFDEIMRSIRGKLLAFDDNVIVVPGHGPQTTIGDERRTNPFLVEEHERKA
jgi:glyoxylase-like metal-dependent hydrolase (beta-lactamase superfamily II)